MITIKNLGFIIEKSTENLTKRGGLAVVEDFIHSIKIPQLVRKHFPKPGSPRGYHPEEYVLTFLRQIIDGERYLEDIRELEFDKGYKELLCREHFPSSDANGDWLRRMGNRGGYECVEEVNKELTKRYMKGNGSYTLDIDTTVIESDKGDAEYAYNGKRGYNPLLGFLSENAYCVGYKFQPGSASPQAGLVEFVEQCRSSLPDGVRIWAIRSDSAGYQSDLINYCEDKDLKYTITADLNVSVREEIENIPRSKWRPFYDKDGFKTDREIAETVYVVGDAEEACRLVIQRWRLGQMDLFDKYGYYVIVSNLDEDEYSTRDVVLFHNKKGRMEDFIGELKVGFGMKYMPCGQIEANSVYFSIGVLAYNIINFLKRNVLKGNWIHYTIDTIRRKLIHVAGKVIRHSRRLILKVVCLNEVFGAFRKISLHGLVYDGYG